MKILAFLGAFICSALQASANFPSYAWVTNTGGSGTDSAVKAAIAPNGFVYVAGTFQGTATFGSTNLTSFGGQDIFVSAQNTVGEFLWVTQVGGNLDDSPRGMAVDQNGNAIITGTFSGQGVFGDNVLTGSTSGSLFIAKIDPTGKVVWAHSAGGQYGTFGDSCAVDKIGNVYVTGFFSGPATFWDGYTAKSRRFYDIFVMKISTSGHIVWLKTFGDTTNDSNWGTGVTVNTNLESFVVGRYGGKFFITKFDQSGNQLWFSKPGPDLVPSTASPAVISDDLGGAYFIGNFTGTASFGVMSVTSAGGEDGILGLYASSGNLLWVKSFGSLKDDEFQGITRDKDGNLLIAGSFQGALNVGATMLTNAGARDILLGKFFPDGSPIYASRAGGPGDDTATDIATDEHGGLAVAGLFSNSAVFDYFVLTSFGNADSFIAVTPAWKTVMTQPPSQLQYGDCVVKEAGKDSLVLITHGAIPPWEDPLTSTTWVDSMSNSIANYLRLNNKTNWQVAGYKWIDKAKYNFIPGSRNYGPEQALVYAVGEGNKLGKCLASGSWSHMHLISHSAGAGLIQAVTDMVKAQTTTVHCTFLDPFVGLTFDKVKVYGYGADWSDQYYSHDLTTGGSVYKVTESLLNHAYNVNVTQLNKVRNYAAFASAGNSVPIPCYQAVTSHGWSIDFYSNTIAGGVNSDYDGFGFPLSKEGGNWTYALRTYIPGNLTPHTLGTADDNCVSFGSVDAQTMLNVVASQNSNITDGDVDLSNYALKLTSHSPSWIAIFINSTNLINCVSFDAEFLGETNAHGLLTAYWDATIVGSLDENAMLPGLQHYTFLFPTVTDKGSHVLGFRIDPLTNVQSIVMVTNITIKAMGPTEPFKLSVTTETVTGLQVYELTGPAGFNYMVESSTNLLNWETIAALVNTNGAVRFYDQTPINANHKYYRAVAPYQLVH